MIYLTGDTHGQMKRIKLFCEKHNTSKDDILIILGDAGINYSLNENDKSLKRYLSNLPITLFCIHGNHEERPCNIKSYISKEFLNGQIMYEEEFPNILFGIDGEIYDMDGKNVLVIGGAYSVDKYYRIAFGQKWFPNEQPSKDIKMKTEYVVLNNKIDIVLSHTCPYKYMPVEWFISGIDQDTVDNSTEEWLDTIYEMVDDNLQKWYCGHFHGMKEIDKMVFMFENYKLLGD